MPGRKSQQTSIVTLLARAGRNRLQSGLRRRLSMSACLALALVWRASLLCLMVCASEGSDGCCSPGLARGEFEAIASVKQLARAGHSCQQRPESQSDAEDVHSSNSDEKNQCCLLDFHTSSQAALLGVFDHRRILTNQAPQRFVVETSLQPPRFTWRPSATSRPSTHLLSCVFLI